MSENRRAPQNPQRRPAQAQGKRPQAKRKRRKRASGRFYVFIAIIALLAIGGGIAVSAILNKDNSGGNNAPTQAPDNNLLSSTDSPDSNTVVQTINPDTDMSALLGNQEAVIQGLTKEQMVKVEDLSVTSGLDERWQNILLLGSDARVVNESSRTDTMIICSINTTSGEVKLTSIMRDMAVDFGDIGQYSGQLYRINAANYFGGPELAMKTVNKYFGMNIQSYVMVDFTSFSVIAEKLGGIEIKITEAEMEEINKNAIQQAKLAHKAGIDETELEATNVKLTTHGDNTHLNGRQTLAYARIRKIDSDFSRAERQRTVLVALLNKLRSRSIADIASLAVSMQSYVTTNLSIGDIISVATTVVASGLDSVEQFRLPVNNSYKQETRREQSMLYDTDVAENSRQLYTFIYE